MCVGLVKYRHHVLHPIYMMVCRSLYRNRHSLRPRSLFGMFHFHLLCLSFLAIYNNAEWLRTYISFY